MLFGLLEPVRTLRRFVALLAKGDIVLAGLLGFLLEGMEHINGLLKLGNIEHSIRIVGLETQFVSAWPNDGHRLKIGWLIATLDSAQLKARSTSGFGGKPAQVLTRRSNPGKRLISRPGHARSGILSFSGIVKLQCRKNNTIDLS
jgi:hypothetical protein